LFQNLEFGNDNKLIAFVLVVYYLIGEPGIKFPTKLLELLDGFPSKERPKMKCPKCQIENPESRKFCRECGTKLLSVCPWCHFENLPGDKFCGECGQDLTKPKETTAVDYSEPRSYTPKFLVDKVLASKSDLVGERKQVTVLFADLKASMEQIADRDPDEARNLIDSVIDRMMKSVYYYEGTVNHVSEIFRHKFQIRIYLPTGLGPDRGRGRQAIPNKSQCSNRQTQETVRWGVSTALEHLTFGNLRLSGIRCLEFEISRQRDEPALHNQVQSQTLQYCTFFVPSTVLRLSPEDIDVPGTP
jgi:hypothetical protein